MENINLLTAIGISLLGISIVFFMLVLIMGVIKLMGTVMGEKKGKEPSTAVVAPAAAPAPVAVASGKVEAKGSLGQLDLHGVEPATAAMLMAIVADEMGVPLNKLYFKSIKEVK